MFYVYERELLGELILNRSTKITLPKSASNYWVMFSSLMVTKELQTVKERKDGKGV